MSRRSVYVGFVRRHELALGLLAVCLVTATSMAITMQGWKAKVPAFDLLTYVYSADQFLGSGSLPQHGDTGSYGSIKPAGTAWLMMPSRILSSDPRLAEYAGTALLHLAALVAIFLLARRYFGFLTAIAAGVLYGISSHGLFLAGSLWPNGRPDFFIVTVLLASQWVMRSDARFLAAALGTWGIGMYVDMGLAPAFFIFPMLWLYYRPPIRAMPILLAAVVVLVVWAPYLAFEAGRGFADIRSQVLLQDIFPADYTSAWCDPSRQLATLPVDQGGPIGPGAAPSGAINSIGAVTLTLADNALSNFQHATLVPLGGLALAVLVVVSLLAFTVPGATGRAELPVRSRFSRRTTSVWAIALIGLGALLHQLPLELLLPDGTDGGLPPTKKVGLGVALGGAVLLVVPWLAAALDRYLARRRIQIQTAAQAQDRRLVVLSLIIPWLILVAFAEAGKPERFWWLWPLQVIVLAALAFHLMPRLLPRGLVALTQLLLLVVLVMNPLLATRLDSWRTTGWAGADSKVVEVVDYVASLVTANGRDRASIGYRTYIYPFMAAYHITNPVYKAGAEFDLLLSYRHGITNLDMCAEGVSGADEYRIVQTRRETGPAAPASYFDEPLEPRFRMLADFDMYQVWARSDSALTGPPAVR